MVDIVGILVISIVFLLVISFVFLLASLVFLVSRFVLQQVIRRIKELKRKFLLAPVIGILSLIFAFSFFLMMISLNKDASILDLLRNPRDYFFDYQEYFFPLALGILPMVTIFLYGDRDFFLTFSKEKLILIPLLLLCAFPASLIGSLSYRNDLTERFSPSSEYPLGLFIFSALLIAYCFSIFLFFSFYLPRKYKLLSWAIVILILGGLVWAVESKPRETERIISEAKITGDIAKCKSIVGKKGIEIKRYECFKEVAIAKKDENLCEEISTYDRRYKECYIEIAIIKKDPTICGKIDDQWSHQLPREKCYIEVAKIWKDPTLCENIGHCNKCDKEWSLTNRNECYKELAVIKKDSALCEKIENEVVRDECFNLLKK